MRTVLNHAEKHKRRAITLGLVVLVTMLCALGCTLMVEDTKTLPIAEAAEEKATTGFPSFTATTLEGEELTEAYFSENRLTLVNYWASWCRPCLNEIPDILRLAEEYEGLQVLGVLRADKDIDGARAFLQGNGVTYPSIVSEGVFEELVSAYNSIPLSFFIDENGRLIGGVINGKPSSYEVWSKIVAERFALLESE